MTYKTHILGGIALALTGSIILDMSWKQGVFYYMAATIGSILPDVDHCGSKVNKYNLFGGLIQKKLGHRGVTHSLIAAFVVIGIGLLLVGVNGAVIGLFVGYLSHLIMDMLNPSGVPLLWPNKKRISIAKVSTNSQLETGVAAMLFLFIAWCIFG